MEEPRAEPLTETDEEGDWVALAGDDDEAGDHDEIEEFIIEDLSIDGMCGVY
jgi:mycofactocin precursor